MRLLTSNQNKLNEFKRFGMENIIAEQGKDLKEVKADSETVIIYKTMEVPNDCLVEDTSLHIEGADVGSDIRWLLDNLSEYVGRKAVWEVLIGYKLDSQIKLYKGIVEGVIVDDSIAEGFGFDAFFKPLDSPFTLSELEAMDSKDKHSARKLCVDTIINNKPYKVLNVKDIPKWTGEYQ